MLETGCNEVFFLLLKDDSVCRKRSIPACPVEASQITVAMNLEETQQIADCKHSEKLLVFAVLVLLMKSPFQKE